MQPSGLSWPAVLCQQQAEECICSGCYSSIGMSSQITSCWMSKVRTDKGQGYGRASGQGGQGRSACVALRLGGDIG